MRGDRYPVILALQPELDLGGETTMGGGFPRSLQRNLQDLHDRRSHWLSGVK
ncbi:MAG: hypothetical protein NW214_10365 [Pseudanabaenaceae cyanobacterium bins.39]|nr:hypothetical protein [Pseudanabaenaceae cyanobacterium bins.39]